MSQPKFLLDVNVLLALTQPDQIHHRIATEWFTTPGLDWGVCSFSQAGFLRVSSNPRVGNLDIAEATAILASFAALPGYRFWPAIEDWISLAAPFAERVFGHRQVTDTYLLGLAIREGGVLVTLDKAFRFLAGPTYATHLLVLGSASHP